MKLLAIDSNSILNRAYYGVRPLTTKDGIYTNGIYGFLTIFLKICEETAPDAVAFAFDLKAPTFRHKLYTEYKAGRHGMPDELAMQLPYLKELLEKLGYPVVSLCGWQVGITTNSNHSDARIRRVDCDRVRQELDRKRIVLVAGFQGVDRSGDVTTLGRGGSDTTAVAMAVALQADLCQIFTDVDGVYTSDPRVVPEAKKLDEITYNEMLELASLGAQVLHNRSVELAKSYNIQLEVLSSFVEAPGTIVKEVVKKVEKTYITGVAQDKKIARIALVGMADEPGVAYKLFNLLAKEKVNVDMILQSLGHDEEKDIVFTLADKDVVRCASLLDENKDSLHFDHMDIDTSVSKVSIVGAGMLGNPGVAAKAFEALYQEHINIHMISTSEIKLSVLIDKADSDRAVRVIHNQFFQ